MGSRLFEAELPIVAAPMSGGASCPALVSAVAGAGAFGFLAAGYKSPDAMAAEMAQLRAAGTSYGVNVFVPTTGQIGEEDFRRYAEELAGEGRPYGLDLAHAPRRDDEDDAWQAKIDLLLENPAQAVSFTFGLPAAEVVVALRDRGTRVLVTVTTVAEALLADQLGCDGLVVQGSAAGGHSGTFDPRRPMPRVSTEALVAEVVAATGLPVLAAGGVPGPAEGRALLAAGADAVAVGTLLLRCDESATTQVHKDALADPARTETVLTRAFTGRPARGLRNGFVDRHEASAPHGYPAIHYLTRELRTAAAAAGHPDRVHLWAGTGYRAARTGPAADIVSELASGL